MNKRQRFQLPTPIFYRIFFASSTARSHDNERRENEQNKWRNKKHAKRERNTSNNNNNKQLILCKRISVFVPRKMKRNEIQRITQNLRGNKRSEHKTKNKSKTEWIAKRVQWAAGRRIPRKSTYHNRWSHIHMSFLGRLGFIVRALRLQVQPYIEIRLHKRTHHCFLYFFVAFVSIQLQ